MPYPYKNIGFVYYLSLVSQVSRPQFQSNPTLASGDVKFSADGAALANLGTLPTVTPASGKSVKVTVAASENTGANGEIIFSDAAGAEWDDLSLSWRNDDSVMDSGVAQGGAAGTITLAATASTTNDLYKGETVEIIAGVGIRQSRIITGYVGSTRVATVGRNWATNPDSTSVYLVLPGVSPKVDDNLRVDVGSWLGTVVTLSGGLPDVNMKTITAGIIAAASFAANALDAVWATGARTLTAFGFSVTVGSNSDKTGYTLSGAGVQAIWDALTSALTTVGSIGKLLVDNINATIGSRLPTSSYAAPLNATQTENAVWDATQASHVAAGSTGESLNDAGNGTTPPTVGAIADAVWDETIAGHLTAGSTGAALNDLVPGAPIEMNAEITENP